MQRDREKRASVDFIVNIDRLNGWTCGQNYFARMAVCVEEPSNNEWIRCSYISFKPKKASGHLSISILSVIYLLRQIVICFSNMSAFK